MGIIYLAKNIKNSKVYIGKTMFTLDKRRQEHKNCAFNIGGRDSNTYFYNAIRKYGWDNFVWRVLDIGIPEELSYLEQLYIEMFGSSFEALGYNTTEGGDGVILNERGRLKIKQSHLNRSKEVYEKIAKKNRGKKRTEESKKRMRDSHLGRKLTEEHRKNISKANKGKHHHIYSDESKKKMSDSHKGKPALNKKKVLCVETNEIFNSLTEAGKAKGINYKNISSVCTGRWETSGGYHWKII